MYRTVRGNRQRNHKLRERVTYRAILGEGCLEWVVVISRRRHLNDDDLDLQPRLRVQFDPMKITESLQTIPTRIAPEVVGAWANRRTAGVCSPFHGHKEASENDTLGTSTCRECDTDCEELSTEAETQAESIRKV